MNYQLIEWTQKLGTKISKRSQPNPNKSGNDHRK